MSEMGTFQTTVGLESPVFAEPSDLTILGARSLEGLNLRIDARSKQLVSAGPILAAAFLDA